MNISNKDKYSIMKILNESKNATNQKKLKIFPDKYPIYGDQECFIEIENLDDLNINDSNNNYYLSNNYSNNYSFNYTNYTGILYTQTDKKSIDFNLKDFYPGKKSILICGIIPSNENEENCLIFIFKNSFIASKEASNSSNLINYNNNNQESNDHQNNNNNDNNCLNFSILIGFTEIKYHKDCFSYLCEYLFHSVYDSKSLENFDPEEYLKSLNANQIETNQNLNLIKDSPFRNHYISFLNYNNSNKSLNKAYNQFLDDKLSKAYKLILLPSDWTILGQSFHINKVKSQSRETLLHLCSRFNLIKFCEILLNLPGSTEALHNVNNKGELPCYIAMKNRYTQISDLMFDHLSTTKTNSNGNDYLKSNTNNNTTNNNNSYYYYQNDNLLETNNNNTNINKINELNKNQQTFISNNNNNNNFNRTMSSSISSSPPGGNKSSSTSGHRQASMPTPVQSTNNPQTSINQKYGAVSALMMPPPLPNNYHHNHHHSSHFHHSHHHHHHNHHHHPNHSHLSIMDIKHFSANLSNSNDSNDPIFNSNQNNNNNNNTITNTSNISNISNSSLPNTSEKSFNADSSNGSTISPNSSTTLISTSSNNNSTSNNNKQIFTDRPLSVDDVIIVDDDDNHVILPIKNCLSSKIANKKYSETVNLNEPLNHDFNNNDSKISNDDKIKLDMEQNSTLVLNNSNNNKSSNTKTSIIKQNSLNSNLNSNLCLNSKFKSSNESLSKLSITNEISQPEPDKINDNDDSMDDNIFQHLLEHDTSLNSVNSNHQQQRSGNLNSSNPVKSNNSSSLIKQQQQSLTNLSSTNNKNNQLQNTKLNQLNKHRNYSTSSSPEDFNNNLNSTSKSSSNSIATTSKNMSIKSEKDLTNKMTSLSAGTTTKTSKQSNIKYKHKLDLSDPTMTKVSTNKNTTNNNNNKVNKLNSSLQQSHYSTDQNKEEIYYQINDNYLGSEYYENVEDKDDENHNNDKNAETSTHSVRSSNSSSSSNTKFCGHLEVYEDINQRFNEEIESQAPEYDDVDYDTNQYENSDNDIDTSDDDEDADLIDDYSCFDTAKDTVLNSTKKCDEESSILVLNDSKTSLSALKQGPNNKTKSNNKLAKLLSSLSSTMSTSTITSVSVSNQIETNQPQSALLPPLPRQLLPQSITLAPICSTNNSPNSSSNQLIKSSATTTNQSSATSTTSNSDFDRNLNLRRSKRYSRQNAQSTMIIQEININSNPASNGLNSPVSSCSPSSSQLSTINPLAVFNKENNNSNLTKAMSTPSIIDKIKSENAKTKTNVNDEDTILEDKLINQHNPLTLGSSASLNIADHLAKTALNDRKAVNQNESKMFKYYKRSDYNLKSNLQKTDSVDTKEGSPSEISNTSINANLNNSTNSKDLVTVNEFLKEFEMTQKKNENLTFEDTPFLMPSSSSSNQANTSRLTTVSDPGILSPQTNLNTNTTPSSVLSLNTDTYEQIVVQQSTPLKNQQQVEAQPKNVSKSKKLGQILKLASVRGAKSKSIKHKYSTQIQQHAFIHKNINNETNCDICHKPLLNKKALFCKNCQINVHETQCKDQVVTCLYFKTPKQTFPLTSTAKSNILFQQQQQQLKQLEKQKQMNQEETSNNSGVSVVSNSNPNSIKTIHFANNRPKSMDITKYFQAHLSKSTSNMYSESVDSLNYKFDENSNLNGSQSNNSITNINASSFKINLNDLNKEFSQFDAEFSANNWADLQSEEYLQTLNKQARNKQENIFEFVKTEVNYVKILSITQKIFVNIMLNECKIEQKLIEQMFPDLDRLIELHQNLLDQLIERYKTSKNKYIESIGDILLNILTTKCEDLVEIYSKVCCTHLSAKSVYKQLLASNKLLLSFSQEIAKHQMLKRYQIPDCLTIITQRLTKYLTLIENMISNSKDDKKDCDLLNQSLEKLRSILTRVNDAVAFYQNANEFKKYVENFDNKSYTYSLIKIDKQIEQRKFTKNDLTNKNDRKILSLNQVNVKCMSKNGKNYKDVTCVTMNDMIVFLQLNDKNAKYIFMNEISVIPCTNGILIRPKVNAITHNHTRTLSISSSSSIQTSNSSTLQSTTTNSTLNTNNSNNNSKNNESTNPSSTYLSSNNTNQNNSNTTNSNSSNSSINSLLSYIVHTITNEIIEIKFPDESTRNQWLTLVHTHITPFIEENVSKDDLDPIMQTNSTPLQTNHLTKQLSNLSHQDSCLSTSSSNSSSSSVSKEKLFKTHKQASLDSNPQKTQSLIGQLPMPLLSSNAFRCNSNCSSFSSGQGSSISTTSSKTTATTTASTNEQPLTNTIEALNLSDSALNTNANSSVASPNPNSDNLILNSNDLLLSADLANILYSFNNLIGQSLFPVNLMRSASSAGETITRSSQDIQVSIPKRAETFNGASSKESQMSVININSDLLKTRVYKNAISSGCIHSLLNNQITNASNTNTQCNSSDAGGSNSNSQTNSDLSADSGYQSRLCVDQNHDIDGDNCSCTFFENNTNLKHLVNRKSSCVTESEAKTTPISRSHFEGILKVILNDYMRIKKENGELKKEIDSKNKSIDLLKKAMDEYKNQLDIEKQDLEKKYADIEKKETHQFKEHNEYFKHQNLLVKQQIDELLLIALEATNTRLIHNSNNNVNNNIFSSTTNSQNQTLQSNSFITNNETNSNKLSILVKCERSLLNNTPNQSTSSSSACTTTLNSMSNSNLNNTCLSLMNSNKKEDNKSNEAKNTSSSILFL